LTRLDRILEEVHRQFIVEQLQPYVKNGTDKYIYELKCNQLSYVLENQGKVYCGAF